MNILYDYQAFTMQNFGGVSKCFAELISNLPQNINYKLGIKESINIYLKENNLDDNISFTFKGIDDFICKKQFRGKYHLFHLYNTINPWNNYTINKNKQYSIALLKESRFDIFHPTFYDPYFLKYIGNKPFVLTIHDMTPELFPQYFPHDTQVKNKKILSQKAAHIIAVSENTKNDIKDILNIPETKISVIYHGINDNKKIKKKEKKNHQKYFLYVGDRYGYKNFIPFIKSMSTFLKEHKDISLICTGKTFDINEKELFQKLNIDKQIKHQFASSEDLKILYKNALAFIYPSLYEGFGIPIIEAMSNNCPVLLNNCSCFPEIAQNAAIYFSLNEKEDNLNKILTDFIANYDYNKKLLNTNAIEVLKQYHWKISAEKLAQVYNLII